jgi:hypothetical protein
VFLRQQTFQGLASNKRAGFYRPRFRLRAVSCLALGLMLVGNVAPAMSRSKEHWGNGLTVDVNHPAEQLIGIVREVAADGFIRGTSQYKDSAQLEGAVPVNSSNLFKPWSEGGAIFYKVKTHTLSPEHFDESGDEGTVAVRYIVQSTGANTSRLRIDAVFQEEARRTVHPSDGTPENGEFIAIEAKIKDAEDQEAQRQHDAGMAQQEQELEKLQATLDQELAELNAVKAKENEVQQQIQDLQKSKAGHVRSATADLKSAPYNKAKTLQSLTQGDQVAVLVETPKWVQVIAPNGEQGWIYRMMIEVVP